MSAATAERSSTSPDASFVGRVQQAIANRCFARAVDLCQLGLNRAQSADEDRVLRQLLDEARRGLAPAPAARPAPPPEFWRGAEAVGRGAFRESVPWLRAALAKEPSCAEAHAELGMSLLALGEFREGWQEYEWRAQLPWASPRALVVPRWDGTPLPGKVLLLWDEQGHGDAIQFVRFAEEAAAASQAQVIFHGRQRVCRLFGRAPGIAQAIPRLHDFPRPAAHASVMSLPAILRSGAATSGRTAYLSAEPELVEAWRSRLGDVPAPRIGIVWQGNPGFFNDRQRSFPLATYFPLLRRFGRRASFVSLQKWTGEAELAELPADVPLHHFGPALDGGEDGFVDTAAVMANLDLVITTDTSTAHLAGALGVREWILLGNGSEWRWGEGGSTTPFYPRARLFRRATGEGWADLLDRVATSLAELLA